MHRNAEAPLLPDLHSMAFGTMGSANGGVEILRRERRNIDIDKSSLSVAPKKPEASEPADLNRFKWEVANLYSTIDVLQADEKRSFPPHLFLNLSRIGAFGLYAPKEYGGLGLSSSQMIEALGFVAAFDPAMSLALGVHNTLGAPALADAWGYEEHESYFREVSAGHRLVAYAITEPGAGSDHKQLQSTYVRNDDGSAVLEGGKIWTGLAAWSTDIIYFCRGQDGRALTAFRVDAHQPGVTHVGEHLSLGIRSFVQSATTLKNVRVAEKDVLEGYGNGWAIANRRMMRGRLVVSSLCIHAAERALQTAVGFAQNRKVSSGILSENGYIRGEISECILDLEIAKMVLRRTLRLIDSDLDERAKDALCVATKIICSEYAFRIADASVQLMGGRGYDESGHVSRFLRDLRGMRILEGATSALLPYLARLVVASKSSASAILGEKSIDDQTLVGAYELRETLRKTKCNNQDPITATAFGEMCCAILGLVSTSSSDVDSCFADQMVLRCQRRINKIKASFSETPIELSMQCRRQWYEKSSGNIPHLKNFSLPGLTNWVNN